MSWAQTYWPELVNLPNVWGNDPLDVNEDEFCPFCERNVPWHYDNCPTRER